MAKRPQIKKLDQYGITDVVTADPSVGETGDLIFNTTDAQLKIWYLGEWHIIAQLETTAGGGVDNVLLTNGDNLLLTNGDVLLLT